MGPWPSWAGSFSTPKKTRRNSVSMYQAPSTTPTAASPVSSQPGTSGRWNAYMPAIVERLADEAVEARQADARHGDEHPEEGQQLQPRRHAAVVGHLPRVVALVEHADEEEQRPGRQAVVDHLQQAAAHADLVQGEHAEHAEAEMGHAAVGDELLDIVLGQGAERSVKDADDRQRADQRRAEAEAGVGRQRNAQPQKAVDADLEAARRPAARCRRSAPRRGPAAARYAAGTTAP